MIPLLAAAILAALDGSSASAGEARRLP
jgi:hypothetical protein